MKKALKALVMFLTTELFLMTFFSKVPGKMYNKTSFTGFA